VKQGYLKRRGEIVDLDVIRKANLRVCFDPMWGAARGYSDEFLAEAGVNVWTVHDYRDVLFGGRAPEPDDHLLDDPCYSIIWSRAGAWKNGVAKSVVTTNLINAIAKARRGALGDARGFQNTLVN